MARDDSCDFTTPVVASSDDSRGARLWWGQLLKRRKVAIDGLKTLESFSTLDKSSLDWEVHLGN
jgi:hypothetical protein